jgi:hypothetical protein
MKFKCFLATSYLVWHVGAAGLLLYYMKVFSKADAPGATRV